MKTMRAMWSEEEKKPKVASRRIANSKKEEVKFPNKSCKNIDFYPLALSGSFVCAFAREKGKRSASDKEERINIFIHQQGDKFRWVMVVFKASYQW